MAEQTTDPWAKPMEEWDIGDVERAISMETTTPPNRAALLALAERVETATGPDRELCGQIATALGWKRSEHSEHWWGRPDGSWRIGLPDWLGSLDAAVSAVPGGFFLDLHDLTETLEPRWHAHLASELLSVDGQAKTAPNAVIAAALRAMAGVIDPTIDCTCPGGCCTPTQCRAERRCAALRGLRAMAEGV